MPKPFARARASERDSEVCYLLSVIYMCSLRLKIKFFDSSLFSIVYLSPWIYLTSGCFIQITYNLNHER